MQPSGVEQIVVTALKLVMFAVMIGGGIAVFRELIPMARGVPPASDAPNKEGE